MCPQPCRRGFGAFRILAFSATLGARSALGDRRKRGGDNEEWRSPTECHGLPYSVITRVGLEGAEVVLWSGAGEGALDGATPCEVAWLPHREIDVPGVKDAALDAFDFVLTNSLQAVPFSSRQGRLQFLEDVSDMFIPEDMDKFAASKDVMLSVVLPSQKSDAWNDPVIEKIAEQALHFLPDHTYVDDGSLETHERAFGPYRFSLIVDDQNHTVSQAFVRCIGFQTVPMFNGFIGLGTMMVQGVLPWNRTHFSLEYMRATLPDINFDLGWLWYYHRLLQDVLRYRYSQPFKTRLASTACTLCRTRPLDAKAGTLRLPSAPTEPERAITSAEVTPVALVGIYSAKANAERRQVIRTTWGRVLREAYGLLVKFFLGEVSVEPRDSDERARREAAAHGDIVFLPVEEGYAMNARKGLLFLEWCAQYASAEFLVKIDDDIYLRPAPLLAILRRRPPTGYIWGYFDYQSPVPKETNSSFYSDFETYPFPTFPPYPRGLVRVMSMDVVRRIAALSRRGALRFVLGDDPCLGVHLRLALLDAEDPLPGLAMDDRDSYRAFAMEPSCNPKLWSHLTARTWAAHHVTAEQMLCMWDADVATGAYSFEGGRVAVSAAAAETAEAIAAVALAQQGAAREPPPLPDLCECVRTGPLAAELANRTDKINASRTFQLWGDPNWDGD